MKEEFRDTNHLEPTSSNLWLKSATNPKLRRQQDSISRKAENFILEKKTETHMCICQLRITCFPRHQGLQILGIQEQSSKPITRPQMTWGRMQWIVSQWEDLKLIREETKPWWTVE